MAYGKIKADTFVYDNSGSDVEVTVASLGSKAGSASPTFTGKVTINAQGDIRLADSDSSNYVGFQSPATVASNVVWTLPATDGSANQYLKTDGSGALSWGTDTTTDSTKLPLAGGTMSGDINLGTNDITNGGTITGTFSGNLTGNVTGNAATATTATNVVGVANASDTAYRIPFLSTDTGTAAVYTDTSSGITYNPSSGTLTSVAFSGALTGNVTGNASGSSGSCTGNAATATGLATARAINGVDFDGTAAITITSAAGTLTGTELKSTVVTSSLTSVGTLSGITIDGAYEQVVETLGAWTIDVSTGNYFTGAVASNGTFVFSNPAASGTTSSFTFECTYTSGTITWPSSVKWNADTAPTLTAGKTHLFMFVTDDGGTRWRGSALVDYVN